MDLREKLSVLLVVPKFKGLGGVERHVQALMKYLRRKNIDVDILAGEINVPIIKIYRLANPSFMISSTIVSIMRRICSRKEFDIIHAHHIFAIPAATTMRAEKLILTLHGTWSEYIKILHKVPTSLVRMVENFALKCADELTAVSKVVAERYRQYYGINVRYIPNAIDSEKIPTDGKRLFDNQIIYAGRLSPEKGIHTLLKAARNLPKDVNLVIVGAGPLEHLVKSFSKRERNVHFLGYLESHNDVLKLIRGSDIFVLPSIKEGLPTVLLEAMYMRTAIIASRIPEISAIIKDGDNGLLFKPLSHKELLDRIIILMEDENLRKKIVQNAYRVCIERFTWEKVIDKYLQLYSEITS